jgi:hypothetical protein
MEGWGRDAVKTTTTTTTTTTTEHCNFVMFSACTKKPTSIIKGEVCKCDLH